MVDYKIIKKGRKGWIKPLPPKALAKSIEAKLSYEKQGAQFMPNKAWAQVKLYKIKTGSFPWGLLDTVIEQCENWESFKPEDKFTICRLNPNLLKLGGICSSKTLRSYQTDAIDALVRNNGGILSIPTGGGKTFTCLSYLELYKQKTLVIVPTVYLKEQWEQQSPDYVDVRTYQGIKDYSELDQYKFIVFDECHHVAASTLWKLAMKLKEQVVVGLSATPWREDGEDMKVRGALGRIVFSVSLKTLIEQGYLSDAQVEWVDLTNYIPEFYMDYHGYYRNYIVENDERNKAIISHTVRNSTKRVLVLVGQIDHGAELYTQLKYLDEDVVFLNGQSKEMDTDHRIIIATSIFDEGVDLPHLDMIVMAAGGKSSIKCLQRIGRVLRKSEGKDKALIIDFVDRCKYLFKHYERRKEIYIENGWDKEEM